MICSLWSWWLQQSTKIKWLRWSWSECLFKQHRVWIIVTLKKQVTDDPYRASDDYKDPTSQATSWQGRNKQRNHTELARRIAALNANRQEETKHRVGQKLPRKKRLPLNWHRCGRRKNDTQAPNRYWSKQDETASTEPAPFRGMNRPTGAAPNERDGSPTEPPIRKKLNQGRTEAKNGWHRSA